MTTSNERPLAGSSDPAARTAGIILIASSVLAVLFMAHHPTAETHDGAALAADIGGKATLSRFVHGGLIACSPRSSSRSRCSADGSAPNAAASARASSPMRSEPAR